MTVARMRASAIAVITSIALAGATTACMDVLPSRLIVDADTLVIYKGRGEPVPVRALGRRGQEVYSFLEVTLSSDSAMRVRREWIDCVGVGESDVTVGFRSLSARLHAVCREVTGFSGASWFNLVLGDSGAPVGVTARLSDGRVIPVPPERMYIRDTSVATLRDGRIVPRGVGHTILGFEMGVHGLARIDVVQRLAMDTLELRPGEFRQWPLAAGRYDIAVRNMADAPRSFSELEMIGEGTRCVPAGRDPDLIHCLVSDTGVLVVRNRHAEGTRRSPRTLVSVVRTN